MGLYWHPDLQVTRRESWLVELRMVYSMQSFNYLHWNEWHTLRDQIGINEEPIWVIECVPEAVEWAMTRLCLQPKGMAGLIRRRGQDPAPTLSEQLQQYQQLIENGDLELTETVRSYKLLTSGQTPFRAWGLLESLSPYVEVL